MKTFIYKAEDEAGKMHRGYIEAEEEQAVRDSMSSAGYQLKVIRLAEENSIPFMEQAGALEEGDKGQSR